MGKVCFFDISTGLGGAERSLLTYIEGLEQTKTTLSKNYFLLFPKNNGPFIESCKKKQIPYKILPLPRAFLKISRSNYFLSLFYLCISLPFIVFYIYKLSSFLKTNHVTKIHCTGLKTQFLIGYSQWLHGCDCIIHIRDFISSPVIKTLFTPLWYNKKIKWISNSIATQNTLLPIQSTVIYNGFAIPKINKHDDFLKELGLTKNTQLIALVGALTKWKGQLQFIEAAKQTATTLPNCRFLIFGDSIYDTFGDRNYKQLLSKKILAHNLQSRVFMMGFRDSETIMAGIDLLVHASQKPEPFGRVVVEAQLAGVPVIAANAGGILEIIDSTNRDQLFNPASPQELAKKLEHLINSPKKLNQIAEASITTAQNKFELTKYVKELSAQLISN